MKRTLVRGSLMLAAAALASGGMVIAPAGAAAPPQTCKAMTGAVTITPGLTTAPHAQSATATAALKTCSPVAKTGGSGTVKATLKLPANSSCQGLATGGQKLKITFTVKWKNAKTTTVVANAVTGKGSTATVAAISGKVTKGLFLNRPVTVKIKVTPKAGENCSPGHPIKHLTFKNTTPFVIH